MTALRYLGYLWLVITASALLLALYCGMKVLFHHLYLWGHNRREFRRSMEPFEAELRALRDASEGQR